MLEIQDRKKIKKWARQIEERQRAFKQLVLKNVAEKVRSDIMAGAPKTAELGNYTAFLSAAEVISGREPETAVLYTGSSIVNAKRLDPDTTLIFMRGLREESPRNQEILEILKLYEPYTTKTFPSNIYTKNFLMTYQTASEKKVNDTALDNRDKAPELAKKLRPLGIVVERDQYADRKMLELFTDLTFQVLQHELKTIKMPKPHWTPALKSAQKKAFLKSLMTASDSVRILADPDYNAFKLSGKMSLKVTQQSVQSTADFMDYLPVTSKAKETK